MDSAKCTSTAPRHLELELLAVFVTAGEARGDILSNAIHRVQSSPFPARIDGGLRDTLNFRALGHCHENAR